MFDPQTGDQRALAFAEGNLRRAVQPARLCLMLPRQLCQVGLVFLAKIGA